MSPGGLLRASNIDDVPRIGVCALNPHAGEQGLFGTEEQEVIAPAVERARAAGLAVSGPLPADTLFARARHGEFDALVAMYHDQGHIALKLLDMYRAVNITLGLPIVRTSVAHGTAFDRAWQGKAETSGMIEAIRVAALLATPLTHPFVLEMITETPVCHGLERDQCQTPVPRSKPCRC